LTVLRAFEHPQLPGKTITIEVAGNRDFPSVKWLFDTFSSGVYGFVPDSRIRKHINEGAVHVIKLDGDLIAAAIGKPGQTLWNIMTVPAYRHLHLGTLLVEVVRPERIRVKCRPHPGMSSQELSRFTDPTPFYEKLGFVEVGWDTPRNYYRGIDKATGRGKFVTRGTFHSVKIMRKLKPGEKAPEPDVTRGPKVEGSNPPGESMRPRVRQHSEGESQIL
jgi:hypothetical protein